MLKSIVINLLLNEQARCRFVVGKLQIMNKKNIHTPIHPRLDGSALICGFPSLSSRGGVGVSF